MAKGNFLLCYCLDIPSGGDCREIMYLLIPILSCGQRILHIPFRRVIRCFLYNRTGTPDLEKNTQQVERIKRKSKRGLLIKLWQWCCVNEEPGECLWRRSSTRSPVCRPRPSIVMSYVFTTCILGKGSSTVVTFSLLLQGD